MGHWISLLLAGAFIASVPALAGEGSLFQARFGIMLGYERPLGEALETELQKLRPMCFDQEGLED